MSSFTTRRIITGTSTGDVLVNGTRIEQIRNDDLGKYVGSQFVPVGTAVAGSESTNQCYYQPPPCTPSPTFNHITTASQQSQLQGRTVPWSAWNPALMTQTGDSTSTCADPSVVVNWSVNWSSHTANGDVTT